MGTRAGAWQGRPMTSTVPPAPVTRPRTRRLVRPAWPLPDVPPAAVSTDSVAAAPGHDVPAAARQLAQQVGTVLVEVLQGRRPVGHLETVADADVYATIEHLARGGDGSTLRLRSVHAQVPSSGVVEAALSLADDRTRTTRAAALRLEHRGKRWICQALEIALTPEGVTRARGSS